MADPLHFDVHGGGRLEMQPTRLVLVGYSGRDEAAVKAHVDELRAHGVPAPADVPAVWDVTPELATQSSSIGFGAVQSSGEVEPVLLLTARGAFLTVGSDHTDRDLERTDMDRAKQACPKVLALRCWPVDSLRPVWDGIELVSSVRVGAEWRPYQQGSLGSLLPPEWFVERFAGDGDVAVFCGTVPASDGLETGGSAFRGALRLGGDEEIAFEYDYTGGVRFASATEAG